MRSLALVCLFFSLCFAKDVTLVQNRELNPQSFGLPLGAIMTWTKTEDPDPDVWIECDGREIDPVKFPKLRAMASHTPNYLERFLRGAGEDKATGMQKEDVYAAHTHSVYSYNNTYVYYHRVKPIKKIDNNNFVSMLFFEQNINKDVINIEWSKPTLNNDQITNYYFYNNDNDTIKITLPEILNNEKFSNFWTYASEYYNLFKKEAKQHEFAMEDVILHGNGDETAPQHVYVRYFIKAI